MYFKIIASSRWIYTVIDQAISAGPSHFHHFLWGMWALCGYHFLSGDLYFTVALIDIASFVVKNNYKKKTHVTTRLYWLCPWNVLSLPIRGSLQYCSETQLGKAAPVPWKRKRIFNSTSENSRHLCALGSNSKNLKRFQRRSSWFRISNQIFWQFSIRSNASMIYVTQ